MSTMSNGVTSGIFSTLVDLQASKPRVNTQVSLNGVIYTINNSNFGEGLAVNSLFANPFKSLLTSLLNSTVPVQVGEIKDLTGYRVKGDVLFSVKATGNTITPSQQPSDTNTATYSDANGNEFSLVVNGVVHSKSMGLKGDNTNDDAAINAFVNFITVNDHEATLEGFNRSSGRILFSVASNPNRRMPRITGRNPYADQFISSSLVAPAISFYGSAAGPDHFFGKIDSVGFVTDIPDVGISIGLSDFSDNIGNTKFTQCFFSNANSTSSSNAVSLQVNWLFDSEFNGNVVVGKPNFGKALQCRKTVFCDFKGGSYSNAFTGITFDGVGASLATTFTTYDIENTTVGVTVDDVGANRILFTNGFIDIRDPIGDAQPSGDSMFNVLSSNVGGVTIDNVVNARAYSELYTGNFFGTGTDHTKLLVKGRYSGQTTPAVLASDAATTNTTGQQQRVTIWGGTVTDIFINGTQFTGLTSGEFVLNPGEFIAIRYSVAPTWKWLAIF